MSPGGGAAWPAPWPASASARRRTRPSGLRPSRGRGAGLPAMERSGGGRAVPPGAFPRISSSASCLTITQASLPLEVGLRRRKGRRTGHAPRPDVRTAVRRDVMSEGNLSVALTSGMAALYRWQFATALLFSCWMKERPQPSPRGRPVRTLTGRQQLVPGLDLGDDVDRIGAAPRCGWVARHGRRLGCGRLRGLPVMPRAAEPAEARPRSGQ